MWQWNALAFLVLYVHWTLSTPVTWPPGSNMFRDHKVYSVSLAPDFDQLDLFLQWLGVRKAIAAGDPIEEIGLASEITTAFPANSSVDFETRQAYFGSLLSTLEQQAPIDFWSRDLNTSVFRVAPEYQEMVEDFMLNNSLRYDIIIQDVQTLVDNERENNCDHELTGRTNVEEFDLGKYHLYDAIVGYMRELEKRYPKFVKVSSIGTTYQGQKIYSIKIGFTSLDEKQRPVIVLDAGIHAREWIAPATALYLINEITGKFEASQSENSDDSNILKFNWHIVPVLNPDGYVYTHMTNRMWRKNRNKPSTRPIRAPWYLFRDCLGSDPNRNFDMNFGGSSTSTNPCSEIFPGDTPFSEHESKALRDLIYDLQPISYVSLHSFSQLLMFPNGSVRKECPDHKELKEIAKKMTRAIYELYETRYKYGPIAQTIYPASGSSTDWAYWKGKVKYSFVFELRDTGNYGFLLPKEQIKPTGKEVWKAMNVLADEIAKSVQNNNSNNIEFFSLRDMS